MTFSLRTSNRLLSSWYLRPSSWTLAVLLTSSIAACGGTYVPGDGGSNSGGSPGDDGGTDGNDGVGGAATGGTGTGGAGTGGTSPGDGGAGCCLAVATCDGTDKQVDSEADCPDDRSCYSRTVCCSTVWCVQEAPVCDGFPSCAESEIQVPSCPAKGDCTERSLCGNTITCMVRGSACYPGYEPDRDYASESPDMCTVIDYVCPAGTTAFSNDCGCGCEQPEECPDYLNCTPSGDPEDVHDPLCDSDECPYTMRVK